MNEVLEAADDLFNRANSALVRWKRGAPAEDNLEANMLQAAITEYDNLRRAAGSNAGDITKEQTDAIQLYIDHHMDPGGLLRAILTNDLAGAVKIATMSNQFAIGRIAGYCQQRVPENAQGSEAAVQAWLDLKDQVR